MSWCRATNPPWIKQSVLNKNPRILAPKLLAAAEGKPCMKCGREDGTVVAAHYGGLWAHKLGKGKGVKCHDFCSVPLCMRCHAEFDSYSRGNDYERGFEFLILILETIAMHVREGRIKL